MRWLAPLFLAFSTYSVLPAPRRDWQAGRMGHVICWLPLVGALPGAALLLWAWLCQACGLAPALRAAGAAVLPLLLSGGIQMDGLMDTADALAARQPRGRTLEIMKDPHCGAFAVLGCCCYLLLSFGLYWQLDGMGLLAAAACCFPLSRALCAYSVLRLPNARHGGMLHALAAAPGGGGAKAAMLLLAALCALAMLLLGRWAGLAAALCAALCLLWYMRLALRRFGGVTGDSSGFFIQVCELAALCGLCLGGCL